MARLSALSLCALVYAAGLALIFQGLDNRSTLSAVPVKAVRLSIAQIELQAAPAPEPLPRAEKQPEVIPEEEVDMALEKVVERPEPMPEPQPEPMPETEAPVAQVTQEASAPTLLVNPDDLQGWMLEQLEKEKYYPAAAERFGLTGSFDLSIRIDENGTIQSAEITSEGGHRILRQAVEKILSKLMGLNYSKPIGLPTGFDVEFEFE